MTDQPPVSVIIPVYNCARYIAEAIESVLAQPGADVDVVVVDDGSTDETATMVRRFASRVRYTFQPQSGIGAARNRGVELARGDVLGFVDADDRWAEGRLARQLAVLAARPELDAVFGQVRQFVSAELDDVVKRRLRCPEAAMPGYVPGAMLTRRSLFARVGRFRTDTRVGEFVDWYLRAQEAGARLLMLPDVVLWRRLHDANQGIRQRTAMTDYVQIVKASLDRRRATTPESPA